MLTLPFTIPLTTLLSRLLLKKNASILLQQFEGIIDKAREQKSVLWIDYANKGNQGNRRIRPLRIIEWEKNSKLFRANCLCNELGCDSSIEKRYHLAHVMKLSSEPFAERDKK